MSIASEVRTLRANGLSIDDICEHINTPRHEILKICRKAGMAVTKEETAITKRRQAEQYAHDEEWAKEYVSKMTDGRYEYVSGYQNMDKPLKVRCTKCGDIRIINCRKFRGQKYYGKTVRCNDCYFAELKAQRERKRKAQFEKKEEDKLKRVINSTCIQMSFSFCECGAPKSQKAKMCHECSRKTKNKNRDVMRRHKLQSAMIDKDITLDKLYRRDKGVCYLCGTLCDWNDYVVTDKTIIAGNKYPSIDHVIPLVRGGEHSWENVRLAHRYCNSIKSDKVEGGSV